MIHAAVAVGCGIGVAVVDCGVPDPDCAGMVQDCGAESGYYDGEDCDGPGCDGEDCDGPDFGAIGNDLSEAMNGALVDCESLQCSMPPRMVG